MLEYKIRQSGDVTMLDLSGRISVGEALAFGPGSGVVLADVIGELGQEGSEKDPAQSQGCEVHRQLRYRRLGSELHQPTTAGW